MKQLKKVLFYLGISLLVVLTSSVIAIFLFKDRIIQQFINEANKKLSTPVKIKKIDVSPFADFPNLSIVFTDVYIEDSHPGIYPLLTADQISFSLNPIEVWQGTYSIKGLSITNSETNLKINEAGKNNFTIIKETKTAAGSAVQFDLKRVNLVNSKVIYDDRKIDQRHSFSSEKLVASIFVENTLYQIAATGDVTINQIGIKRSLFLENKNFEVDARVDYDDSKKEVLVNESSLKISNSAFTVNGSYLFKDKTLVDFKAEGKDTDIQTLLSLMPESAIEKLKQYRSDGDVFFNLDLKGEISGQKNPSISISFGCTNTTLYHPDFKTQIKNANLKGSFASPSVSDFANAKLFIQDVKGELNNQVFNANLSIQGFASPYVAFDFKGDLDASSIYNFYPIPLINDLTGSISADISFEGQTAMLKKKATVQQVKTNGAIVMSDINFGYGSKQVKFNNLNGTLQFNNHDLALSNVTGTIENSDFRLNGFFKNIVTFLLFENQPIGIESDLKSDFLDLDQLFTIGFGEGESSNYKFNISPNLQLNFNCDVSQMRYKRFNAKHIKGDLLVKNQVAVSRNIAMNTMGGSLLFNGIVDAKNNKAIDVVSTFKLNGIRPDSVFYVFENFNQNFIQDKHLKGQVYADVEMEMTLNEELHLISPTLIADISATIKNGELNNFEPLQALNKYLDDEGLSKLRFADLKNEIHIENQTIYIPQMEIKSNVTSIQLSGTHTFDQHINYRVVAPLRGKRKVDPDEAFGAIEEVPGGQPKIFLKITGTTANYDISLDKEAVKKKIAADLKKEVQELKDAFKQKGIKKKKELELSDEEFDWDNDN